MTFNHTDIDEHLVGFLYGELEGDVRAAFESHVESCERCRSEVAAFQRTRATARAVVRAPLGHPVPEAVRARVMEAAARAVAGRASSAERPQHPASTVAAAAPRDTKAPPRWLAWLRARWAVPMFATVAAMAVLLLVRETIFREARHPLGETALNEPIPPTAADPSAGPASASAPPLPLPLPLPPPAETLGAEADRGAPTAGSGLTRGPSRERVVARLQSQPGKPDVASTKRHLAPTGAVATGAAPTPRRKGAVPAPPGPPRVAAKEKSADFRDVPLSAGGKATPKKRDDQAMDSLLEGISAAPAARSVRRNDRVSEEESDVARPSVTSAPPASAAVAAPTAAAEPRAPRAEAATTSSDESPTADEDGPQQSQGQAKAAPSDPAASLSDRADKLAAAGRWPEAVAAYRELLQRFPRHASAPAWRRRLAAAQSAAAAADANRSRFAAPPPLR